MKAALVRFASLPADLIGLVWWLIVLALWGRVVHDRPMAIAAEPPDVKVWAVELKPDSWPARTWYKKWGGTTLGHFIMFGAGRAAGARIWRHELVHVLQCEAVSVGATVLALVLVACGQYLGALIVWCTPYPIMGVGGWLGAWLRGLRFYRDSQHERSAYAQQYGTPQSNEEITPVTGQRPIPPPAGEGVLPVVPPPLSDTVKNRRR